MSAPERMSLRKFWCCPFGGEGIGAQFDSLAIRMTGGFDEQPYALHVRGEFPVRIEPV